MATEGVRGQIVLVLMDNGQTKVSITDSIGPWTALGMLESAASGLKASEFKKEQRPKVTAAPVGFDLSKLPHGQS